MVGSFGCGGIRADGFTCRVLFLMASTDAFAVAILGMLVYGLGRGFSGTSTMPILCHIVRSRYPAAGYGFLNLFSTFAGGATILRRRRVARWASEFVEGVSILRRRVGGRGTDAALDPPRPRDGGKLAHQKQYKHSNVSSRTESDLNRREPARQLRNGSIYATSRTMFSLPKGFAARSVHSGSSCHCPSTRKR